MAATAVQLPTEATTFEARGLQADSQVAVASAAKPKRHDVHTTLNYYKPNEDGSPPHPTYIDRPETYERPFEQHAAIIHDVTGLEAEYTLDGNGFQFHRHTSVEKDFVDDAQIKAQYYPETEQLLKDVYVPTSLWFPAESGYPILRPSISLHVPALGAQARRPDRLLGDACNLLPRLSSRPLTEPPHVPAS
jgi:hypothetical protein